MAKARSKIKQVPEQNDFIFAAVHANIPEHHASKLMIGHVTSSLWQASETLGEHYVTLTSPEQETS